MRADRSALLIGCLLLSAAARPADISPHELLERMSEAVRTLDYEGRLVVQAGDQMDAMYIVHRVDQGTEKERVVSLTGQPREIIRSDEAVACLVPGRDNPINVRRPAHHQSFSPLRGVSTDQLEMSYRLQILEEEKVAGREAHQVLIRPQDDLRYGYRLFIDRESDLPLRSVMFDEAMRIVSQMMFVELKTGPAVTPIERDISTMRRARADRPKTVPLERLARPVWDFRKTPPGFELAVHRRRPLPEGPGELEHFIFSDGLATVSVYIQPHNGDGALSGESVLGGVNAVGRILDGHEVVVVGEVPLKTLHWFAQYVEPAKP